MTGQSHSPLSGDSTGDDVGTRYAFKADKFDIIGAEDALRQAVVPLIGVDEEGMTKHLGTAFCIAVEPYTVLVTARHVLIDRWVVDHLDSLCAGTASLQIAFETGRRRDDGIDEGHWIPVHQFAYWPGPPVDRQFAYLPPDESEQALDSDVAVMTLAGVIDGEPLKPLKPISFGPPTVGGPTSMVGYPLSEATVHAQQALIELRRRLQVSSGTVTAVSETGFPKVKGPSFEGTADLEGGMSGGPVIIEQGVVCAVASAAFPLDGADHQIAHVTLLGPILDLPAYWDPKLPEKGCTVRELVAAGSVVVSGEANLPDSSGSTGQPYRLTLGQSEPPAQDRTNQTNLT